MTDQPDRNARCEITTDFPDILFKSVIFLYPEAGEVPIGTAFIVGYPIPGKSTEAPLVVTAKHVVGDRRRIIGRFNSKSPGTTVNVPYDIYDLRGKGDLWEHTDNDVDLVVFRTPCPKEAELIQIPLHMIASKDTYRDEEIKATDRVIFPSLLVNLMETSRNYPIMRDGSIALIPDDPIPLKYKINGTYVTTKQQVLLIDAMATPGASGAPVFSGPGLTPGKGGLKPRTGPWMLGVIQSFLPALRPSDLKQLDANVGIGIVFPSWKLLEILQCDALKTQINKFSQGQE